LREDQDESKSVHVSSCDFGGRRAVSARPFEENEMIVKYYGEVLSNSEWNARQKKLDDEASSFGHSPDNNPHQKGYGYEVNEFNLVIDAGTHGSSGRFFNHTCADANVVVETWLLLPNIDETSGRVVVVMRAKQDISLGENLRFRYRVDLEKLDFICACGHVSE
jgi:SET domain-containing protein